MSRDRRRRICLILLLLSLLLGACAGAGRESPESTGLDLPRNTNAPEDYTLLDDGAVSYPGARQGVDVSAHQREIDWVRVRAAGVDFALLQIGYRGYTEGGLMADERFEENYKNARAAGVEVGVYFYSQATSEQEAEEEANFVLSCLGGRALELPVFFDWEEVARGRTAGFAGTAVTDYALAFCRRLEAAGYVTGVYFNQAYGYSHLHLDELSERCFWLAEYRSYQSFYYEVGIWQYACDGRVDGIQTVVDRDLLYVRSEETEPSGDGT